MNIITTNEKEYKKEDIKGKIIRNPVVTKALLHCEPRNVIIDIKPDKTDPTGQRCVHVFLDDEKFQKDLARILKQRDESRMEAEIERRVRERLKEYQTKE